MAVRGAIRTNGLRAVAVPFAAALIGLLGAGSAGAGDEPPLAVGDFAVGRVLEADSAHVLHAVALDLAVYRHSVEPGLADLRIFDGQGEAVPHAIRHAPSRPAAERRLEPLPVFPLPADDGAGAGNGGFRIDAEVSDSGAILRLEGGPSRLPGPATRGAWILDASALGTERIVGLELGLAPSAGDFIGYLRVERSSDLSTFRVVKDRVAVARLASGGHEIDRLEVDVPATRARYLRLTLVDGVLPAAIDSVSARLASSAPPPAVTHTRLTGTPIDGEPGAYLYDIGAHLPIDRIDVVPGEPNTLIEVRIDSAEKPDGPWSPRHTALVYRLDDGETLRSAPIRWRRGPDRYLRLVVSSKGDGHRRVAPGVDVAWRPAQVLFVTRGRPPFTLAVGKRGAPDVAFRADALVRLAGSDAERLDEATAVLGPPIVLAGDAAFDEPRRPVSWRQVGLWAALVGAVGIVLGLSIRLLRRDDGGKSASAG